MYIFPGRAEDRTFCFFPWTTTDCEDRRFLRKKDRRLQRKTKTMAALYTRCGCDPVKAYNIMLCPLCTQMRARYVLNMPLPHLKIDDEETRFVPDLTVKAWCKCETKGPKEFSCIQCKSMDAYISTAPPTITYPDSDIIPVEIVSGDESDLPEMYPAKNDQPLEQTWLDIQSGDIPDSPQSPTPEDVEVRYAPRSVSPILPTQEDDEVRYSRRSPSPTLPTLEDAEVRYALRSPSPTFLPQTPPPSPAFVRPGATNNSNLAVMLNGTDVQFYNMMSADTLGCQNLNFLVETTQRMCQRERNRRRNFMRRRRHRQRRQQRRMEQQLEEARRCNYR